MEINQSIFKSYDIRGIYPEELNDQGAFEIGRAFTKYTGARKIALGRDMRISSPALFNAFAKGAISAGADIYDLGEVPTECIYFAVQKLDLDAGAMVTASHNPKEYNGFKMVKKSDSRPSMVRGKTLAEIIEKDFQESGAVAGKIFSKDIWPEYKNHVLSFAEPDAIKPLKVVVDAGNGMAGKVMPFLFSHLQTQIIPLNFELDGSFPNRPSNPLAEGASDQIAAAIKENKADFGFMFDGDADRIFLVDERGNLTPADATLLLLAKYFLEKNPGAGIAYNLICSKSVPEFIEKWGGRPIRTKVGFINVMEGIAEKNGVMGGELSGHYCFRDNFYSDSGSIAFLVLLSIISQDGRKVSEIVSGLNPYFKDAEVNLKVAEKDAVIGKVKEKYGDGKKDELDGITVEYPDWWFNVRASNTEPLLRITVEADTKELLEEKKRELVDFIKTL